MENITKEAKNIAKKNFLILEANYKTIKKLANKSSNDADFDKNKTSAAQSFLTGYDYVFCKILKFQYTDILHSKSHDDTMIGYIPNKYYISELNKVYYAIKHNKFDTFNNFDIKLTNYLTSNNINIKKIEL